MIYKEYEITLNKTNKQQQEEQIEQIKGYAHLGFRY